MKKNTDRMKTSKKRIARKIPEDFLILSPEKEFESFAQQQIEEAVSFGDNEKAELYRQALERGRKVLETLGQE